MELINIEIKDIKNICSELSKKINKDFKYDLVIFIAKGSYLIGKEFSNINNVPLLEIKAERKGGKLKKILKPILRIMPKKLLKKLREKEMQSSIHVTNSNRNVLFDYAGYSKYKDKKRILLVDDSVDTGNSFKLCLERLKSIFANSDIKTCAFNVMNHSTFVPDYYLYKNTMICGPWSSDSSENNDYLKLYTDWVKKEHK